MSHSSKLFTGGIALLLISASGCAGQGLKSMFARNETDGYKTLEELEAEDAKAAEEESAVADADSAGPRFAPWLPFGKKSSEETDSIASSSVASSSMAASDSTSSDTAAAWWKNPFRRREPVELDPFLTQEELPSTTVVQSKKEAAFPAKSADAAVQDKEFLSTAEVEKSVKAVSHKSESNALSADDELLAEKFEKHFQKNTIETADASDQAQPLIVAGETFKTVQAKSESSATDKLAELERLLEDRRSSATIRNSDTASIMDKSIAKTQASTNRTRANRAVDSFDSLLTVAPSEDSASTRHTSGSRNSGSHQGNSTPASSNIEVAKSDWLFGAAAAVSAAKETRENLTKTATNGWSDTSNEAGFQWIQAARSGTNKQQTQNAGAEESRVKQSDIQFAASPASQKIPAASLPDTPDFNSQYPTGFMTSDAGPRTISESGMTRMVSARREVSSPTTPEELADDSFFTKTTSASNLDDLNNATPRNAGSSPSQVLSADSGSRGLLNSRHWLLLLGGIIVVALLFAPARKKPMQAHHAPVGG